MNIPQRFHRICGRSKLYLKRSSPTILCCIAAVGVVGTAVAAARATPKAMKLLEETSEDNAERGKLETVMIVAPAYIPAAAIGIGTVLCIFGANVLNKRQQTSLVSAYTLMSNYYREYRGKLIELYGEETDNNVRSAMAREHCNYHQLGLDAPDGKAIFYEEISGESIHCYEREIMDAEYHLNRNYALRGYAFLNELYEFLGLPPTEYGNTVGWSVCSGIGWIDFQHRLIDSDDGGSACYSIDMIFPPELLEEWEC